MCVSDDSRPPIAPISGAAVDHQREELEGADGNRLAAFAALPSAPGGAGMLVLPDVRGLHPFYEELSLRLAEEGLDTLAIDYFGRTADTSERGDGFPYQEHVAQVTWDGMRADIVAGCQWLQEERGVRALFSVGFCLGGRLALLSTTLAEGPRAGAIGFYPWPVGPHRGGTPAPAEIVDEMAAPILALFGGADSSISQDQVATFEEALSGSNVEHEVVTYPGAPHGFFDKKENEFADESADAWARVLGFVRERRR